MLIEMRGSSIVKCPFGGFQLTLEELGDRIKSMDEQIGSGPSKFEDSISFIKAKEEGKFKIPSLSSILEKQVATRSPEK